jgi:hypothetical protein
MLETVFSVGYMQTLCKKNAENPVPGRYKYGDLALQIGTVSIKYGIESRGTALARTSSNSKIQTRPLVREGATK